MPVNVGRWSLLVQVEKEQKVGWNAEKTVILESS